MPLSRYSTAALILAAGLARPVLAGATAHFHNDSGAPVTLWKELQGEERKSLREDPGSHGAADCHPGQGLVLAPGACAEFSCSFEDGGTQPMAVPFWVFGEGSAVYRDFCYQAFPPGYGRTAARGLLGAGPRGSAGATWKLNLEGPKAGATRSCGAPVIHLVLGPVAALRPAVPAGARAESKVDAGGQQAQ